MRKALLATALTIGLAAGAHAQQLKLNASVNDPTTGLGPAEWEALMSHYIDGTALQGIDGVLVISSLPVQVTVTCGRWQLVGTNVDPGVKGNPTFLKPYSVTFIKTHGFDGYCKDGIIAHPPVGKPVVGTLDSSDGTFKNSTIITFSGVR